MVQACYSGPDNRDWHGCQNDAKDTSFSAHSTSLDGTVAKFHFEVKEIGQRLSDVELEKLKKVVTMTLEAGKKEHETLIDAWLHMKEMLRNFHGHNLTKDNIIKIFYHGLNETALEALNSAACGIFLYKTLNQAYQLLEDKDLLKLDWAKNQKPKPSLKKTIAFANEGSNNSDTDKIMARMDAMTLKMDAQYKEMKSRHECNRCGGNHSTAYCNDDDTPMSLEEEAKFKQTF
ncbi:hypothetical protein Tco_0729127 [Tanacetum coccineum]|uniref:Uncharacterized protein n=1 Tax=Tanacetum coccineum TaxID=301880 RepID=A0ABQ4YQF1_9ASTR